MIFEITSAEFSPQFLERKDLPKALKINVGYDIEKIKKLVLRTINNHQMYRKDQIDGYSGISLHYAESDNIYNAGVSRIDKNTPVSSVRYFDKVNEIGKEFAFIQNTFSKINLVRGRILVAEPNTVLPWHTDLPMNWRLHIPVLTHSAATIDFRDRSYHLPADGGCYLINGAYEHQMQNASPVTRAHIIYEVMTYKILNLMNLKPTV